jgi:calpain
MISSFWINGKWVEVVVDDRLPVNQYGQLNCLKSSAPNEFWSALLEKAYAKIFGGYEALDGGLPYEAFEDFTGGISEIFDLKQAPKNLYEIMTVAVRRGSMMACAVNPDPNIKEAVLPNGLVQGHAYSITGVKTVQAKVQGSTYSIDLVRLRNPWGQGEWNGSWSDNSIEWKSVSDEQKKDLDIKMELDGEFWMSYQDFISHYERLDICNISPHSLHDDKRTNNFWERKFYDGAWIKGKSAGGCRNNISTFHTNPQYVMTLKNVDETDPEGRCNVLIALMQKNGRSKEKGSHYVPMGFSVYSIREEHLDQVPLNNDFFRYNGSIEQTIYANTRGVTARYKFHPGHYLIVPSTYHQNVEAEFLLRVCSEKNEAFSPEEFERYKEKNKDKLKKPSKFTPVRTACL